MQVKGHCLPALISVADSDLNGSVLLVESEEKGWKDGAALLLYSVFALPQAKFTYFWKELNTLKQTTFVIHSKPTFAILMLVWCSTMKEGGKFPLEQKKTPSGKPSFELNGDQNQFLKALINRRVSVPLLHFAVKASYNNSR